nr:hypothetical protein [Parabacteroides goldsteinii]
MMTLSNFEYYVLPRIWERGVAYYRQGAVESLEEEFPDEWNATVRGTEEYTVEITLEDDKIMDYFCDCPYDGDIEGFLIGFSISKWKHGGSEIDFRPIQENRLISK